MSDRLKSDALYSTLISVEADRDRWKAEAVAWREWCSPQPTEDETEAAWQRVTAARASNGE